MIFKGSVSVLFLISIQWLSLTAAKKGLAMGFREFMCDDFTAWDNVTWW